MGPGNSTDTGYGNTTTGGNSTKPGGNSTTTPGGKCTIPSGVLAHAKDRETQVMVLQQAVLTPLEYSHHRISLCTPKVGNQAFLLLLFSMVTRQTVGMGQSRKRGAKTSSCRCHTLASSQRPFTDKPIVTVVLGNKRRNDPWEVGWHTSE